MPEFLKRVEAKYIDKGIGNFSRLLNWSFNGAYSFVFDRTEYSPTCFGVLSTLESPTKMVLPRRSMEVNGGWPGKFSCFGGGTPFGLQDFEKWTQERVFQESNHYPRLDLLGLVLDNEMHCDVLAYRGFVDEIDRKKLPRSVMSRYGVMKYSELVVLPKTELHNTLAKNKVEFTSHSEPLYSEIALE